MPAENAMNHQAQFVSFEINPVIPHPETMQRASGALEFSKLIHFGLHNLLRQPAKLAQDIQLEILRHLGQFGRAGWIENDLKRTHRDQLFERRHRCSCLNESIVKLPGAILIGAVSKTSVFIAPLRPLSLLRPNQTGH